MAATYLFNKEWDVSLEGQTIYFYQTQLSQAAAKDTGMAYQYGWLHFDTGTTFVDYSDIELADGAVEATFTP